MSNEKLNLNPTQDALIQAGIAALETFLQGWLSKQSVHPNTAAAPMPSERLSQLLNTAAPKAKPPVVNANQWADPNGNNMTVDQFTAFKKGSLAVWGITVVSSRVQAWAPIEAGSTPGGPGGGFIEGYAPLATVTNSLLGRTDIPIAIECQLETFGNGHVISWPFASQLAATFMADETQPTDAGIAAWLAGYCTPAFSQVNYIATLEVWRAENS